MDIPGIILDTAAALEVKVKEKYPALAPLVRQCYLNTIETTVKPCENGDWFVITGDIPALWLRDSAAQLRPYMPLCAESEALREIIRGVIRRHAFYIGIDPYANAFNEGPIKGMHTADETDFYSDYIWERKYETDSLCASVYLLADYYDAAKDSSVFTPEVHAMLRKITDTLILEQHHNERSAYFFRRTDCPETDTMPHNGKGNPVGYTGMTWSGFRPSDDRCYYNYLIPANMMAVVAARRAAHLFLTGYQDKLYAEKANKLSDEIDAGIRKYGMLEHEKFGQIYAYETDGLGNFVLMDDANSPSLLSLPYLGYCDKADPVYQNTRRFILSEDNPWYFSSTAAKGVGSPHTGKDKIWHIALVMQILTSTDPAEMDACAEMLSRTHAGTFFMHESFHKDDPANYTRSWFAWANSLFAQMLPVLLQNH